MVAQKLLGQGEARAAVAIDAAQIKGFAFAIAVPEKESDELSGHWTIPAPGKPLFEAAATNFDPHSPAKVATETRTGGPAPDHRREGPHRPRGGHPGDARAVPPLRGGHRPVDVRRPRPLADHRLRLARRRRRAGALTTDDDWLWALQTDLLSAVRATRAALPHLVTRAPSSTVTVCSVDAALPDPA